MPNHKTGTREEWDAARTELLGREKELTRMSDELARQRRELPWVEVDKRYTFGTADGPRTLAELFDGRSQLVVYHFMFGPDWEAGCPVCSSIADSFNGVLAHLEARDVTMICVSRAPIEKLLAYRERMGWSFNWASSYESDFNWDFEHSKTREAVSDGPTRCRRSCRGSRPRAGPTWSATSPNARSDCVRALGRRRVPDLRDHGPGARGGDDLLRHPRPDAARPRRG